MPPKIMIDHGGRDFVRLQFDRCGGAPAVGQSRLSFQIELTMLSRPKQDPDAIRLCWVGGSLHDAKDGAHIADFRPAHGPWDSPEAEQKNPNHIQLEAHLRQDQLRELEQRRTPPPSAMRLQLQLHALVQTPARVLAVVRPNNFLEIDINASDWLRLLTEMRWEDRATFEVPVKGGRLDQPPFDKAASFLRDAIVRRDEHKWPDAVGQCREVFDHMSKVNSSKAPTRREWSEKDPTTSRPLSEQWSVSQRIEFIRAAVDHATNVGHHRVVGDPSPKEARLLVAMTALFLKLDAEQ